jgi:hypothetical protein
MENKQPTSYAKFMKYASNATGFTEAQIVELLKPKFKCYTSKNDGVMMDFLMQKRVEAIEKEARPVIDTSCPICGAETVGDLGWYGIYTKTPGWRCKKGGLAHFLEWKAQRIQQKVKEREERETKKCESSSDSMNSTTCTSTQQT